jgi:membrane dipeptidase
MTELVRPETAGLSPRSRRRLERWQGYRSYQYLEAGTDYRAFDLAPDTGREPGAEVSWDAATEAAAARFEQDNFICSVHDHLSLRPADPAQFAECRREGREFLPYQGIAVSDVDLFFDGGAATISMVRSRGSWEWDDTVNEMAMRQADIDHQDLLVVVRSVADLDRVRAQEQVGVVFCLEAATAIESDLDRLDLLYGLGVRSMGLVFSTSNLVGGGLGEDGDGGLTRFGRRVVHRMNELGIIVDVAHAGDRTSLDAFEHSSHPVVITHAGARAVWPSGRMKPDDVIRACAETGGFIGIEAAPHTTEVPERPAHDLGAVMRHVEYCLDLVGPDHVALGPDTNFGDHVAWHRLFYPPRPGAPAKPGPPREDIDFVRGVENPAHSMSNMIRWLFAHGYSEQDVAKVAGGNALRVIRAVWSR